MATQPTTTRPGDPYSPERVHPRLPGAGPGAEGTLPDEFKAGDTPSTRTAEELAQLDPELAAAWRKRHDKAG